MDHYKKAMDQIKASESFKEELKATMKDSFSQVASIDMKRKESRYRDMKKMTLLLTACALMAFAFFGFGANGQTEINLLDRMEIDQSGPAACAAVNIEGYITEVGEDGLSFQLDNGKWVYLTDDTELGISGPNAAPKEEQFFEPTFRVGNLISGFTLDEEAKKIEAYAIYGNWNWDDPIR